MNISYIKADEYKCSAFKSIYFNPSMPFIFQILFHNSHMSIFLDAIYDIKVDTWKVDNVKRI
jgi:hypothetical protein